MGDEPKPDACRTTSGGPADEKLGRRQLIQRRMPKREQIQALVDRRPDRDPWLDDRHDWRP